MGRRWLRVRILPSTVLVNGPGSGNLIVEAGGKVMWSRAMKSYVTNQATADKVMALADRAGYVVEFYDERFRPLVDLSPTGDEVPRDDFTQPELDLSDAS